MGGRSEKARAFQPEISAGRSAAVYREKNIDLFIKHRIFTKRRDLLTVRNHFWKIIFKDDPYSSSDHAGHGKKTYTGIFTKCIRCDKGSARTNELLHRFRLRP